MSDAPGRRPAPALVQELPAARKLITQGRAAEAAVLLRRLLARDGRNATARRLLATLGPAARPTLQLAPEDHRALDALRAAMRRRDWEGIAASAPALLERQPRLGEAANALGAALQALGRNTEALRAFDHALRADPALADTYVNYSGLLRTLGQMPAAIDAARAGLDVAPELAAAHLAMGLALDDGPEAEQHLRKAVYLTPMDPVCHDALCRFLERRNRLDDFAEALEAAKADCPGDTLIGLQEVALLSRRHQPEAALARLDALPVAGLPPETRGEAEALRGRALDTLNRTDEAFAAFTEMNAALRARPGSRTGEDNPFLGHVRARLAGLDTLPQGGWPDRDADEGIAPVFLVGYPRSGTTLLDTMLRGHPGLATLEEQPIVATLLRDIRPGNEGPGLGALDARARAARRAAYRARFEAAWGAPLGERVPVDRMPFNLVEAAAILRVFPSARFLLMLRHPCDVVLSSVMQNFVSNAAMDNFTTLEDSARLYDLSFSVWTGLRERLGFPVTEIRYETLVADPEPTLAAALTGLGLPAPKGLGAARAGDGARIKTASYRQVGEPLHRNSDGRWRRYETQMAPVLDRLAPWIDRLGYA